MQKSRTKQSLNVKSFEKALTKNNDGSWKDLYEKNELVKGITKLVSEFQMDGILVVFCGFKNLELGSLNGSLGGFECIYRCVYMAEDK